MALSYPITGALQKVVVPMHGAIILAAVRRSLTVNYLRIVFGPYGEFKPFKNTLILCQGLRPQSSKWLYGHCIKA
jgi:hypothetical protein